ncbi:hypothetical protein [Rickettsiella endosymbiont of Rhagonycha lignosa]|uniref:hypothetical protein n=1 Tax=Rickettsiella endosymbiont of Rhagonycha lignosa TaxID=3077937 RepID=UPI00313ED60F
MAKILKPVLEPSLTRDYQPDGYFRYLKNELEKIRFEPPSVFNQVKKLFIYLALLIVQKKTDDKEEIAVKNKLISSFKTLDFAKESNLLNLSKINEIKSITLEYLNRRKTEQDNLDRKLKINKNNSKEIESRGEQVAELQAVLHEMTAKNPIEHEAMLQKSYVLLKMQPWADGESKKDFQSRLTDSRIDARINAKTIADVDSVKTNDILADIDDAYKYLRNHATPLPNIPARFCNRDEEDEIERSMKSNFSPSSRGL